MAEVLTGILFLLPALTLVVALLARRYPGERVLVGLRSRGTRRARWPRPRSSAPRALRSFVVAPHGGLLIARSLAVRPPPAFHAAS